MTEQETNDLKRDALYRLHQATESFDAHLARVGSFVRVLHEIDRAWANDHGLRIGKLNGVEQLRHREGRASRDYLVMPSRDEMLVAVKEFMSAQNELTDARETCARLGLPTGLSK